VSISSIFNAHFFADILAPKKFIPKTQLCNFLGQNIGAKCGRKMLIKLTPPQHFMNSFCTNILLPKNYKAKLLLKKICAKHFCIKKVQVKC